MSVKLKLLGAIAAAFCALVARAHEVEANTPGEGPVIVSSDSATLLSAELVANRNPYSRVAVSSGTVVEVFPWRKLYPRGETGRQGTQPFDMKGAYSGKPTQGTWKAEERAEVEKSRFLIVVQRRCLQRCWVNAVAGKLVAESDLIRQKRTQREINCSEVGEWLTGNGIADDTAAALVEPFAAPDAGIQADNCE